MVRSSSIIVKNQFANINHHKGGSTPANFVANYTIRKDATEMIYPVSRPEFGSKSVNDTDSTFRQFIKATNKLDNSFLDNKRSQQINNQSLKMEGRCFDQDVVSCGTERIYERLNDIEQAYDNAHTVLELIISFDKEYLKQMRVLPDNKFDLVTLYGKSDLRSSTDDLKLRLAVKHGINRLSKKLGYTKPVAIGSIQLDTDNPHAHVVLTETDFKENSKAKLWYDGLEIGTLDPSDCDILKKGIDNQLEITSNFDPTPAIGLTDIANRIEDISKKFRHLKVYSELSGMAILPKNHDMTRKLARNIRKDTSIFDLSDSQIQNDVKKSSDKPITELSPFLKIQLIPLQNQVDLNASLFSFSKKRAVKQVLNDTLVDNIVDLSEKYIHNRLANKSNTASDLLLNQTLSLFIQKDANNKFVYSSPQTSEVLEQHQSKLTALHEALYNDKTDKQSIPSLNIDLNFMSPTQSITSKNSDYSLINAEYDRMLFKSVLNQELSTSELFDRLKPERQAKVTIPQLEVKTYSLSQDALNSYTTNLSDEFAILTKDLQIKSPIVIPVDSEIESELLNKPKVELQPNTISKQAALDTVISWQSEFNTNDREHDSDIEF